MARLNLFLLLAVLASAIYLVHTQYLSRQLFTEFHSVELEARRLELDRDRLEVEKRAQATPLRVEKLAKEQLKMRTTTPAITQYVRPDGTVLPAIAAASAPVPTPVGATQRTAATTRKSHP